MKHNDLEKGAYSTKQINSPKTEIKKKPKKQYFYWRSCAEQLPEESGEYLTFTDEDDCPRQRTLLYSAKWKGWNCSDWKDDEAEARKYELSVTHWAPLPNPPEVGHA